MRSLLKWFAATGLAVWGLSALAAHLPPRLRLLLLFSVTFGLLVGWSAAVIAAEFQVARTRGTAAIVVILAVAGLVNQTVTSCRQVQAAARESVADDPQQLLALRLLESGMQDDPALRQRFYEERARLQPTFSDYLATRLTRIGWFPAPWPALIWGLETLLGGLAAALLFRRPSTTGWQGSRTDNSELSNQKSKIRNPKSQIDVSDANPPQSH